MYSREMGGIRSDGQLYGMQQELQQETFRREAGHPEPPRPGNERSEYDCPTPQYRQPDYAQPEYEKQEYQEPACAAAPASSKRHGLLDLHFLHDLKTEDLLLLAIGFLLLTDSGEENNDLLILLVGLLLLL